MYTYYSMRTVNSEGELQLVVFQYGSELNNTVRATAGDHLLLIQTTEIEQEAGGLSSLTPFCN